MKYGVALLLVICIILHGVQGDQKVSLPKLIRRKRLCNQYPKRRKCHECPPIGGSYLKTIGNYVGSVATKECDVNSAGFIKKKCTKNNGWVTQIHDDSCQPVNSDAGNCANLDDKNYEYISGTLIGSEAAKICKKKCGDGEVSLIKHKCNSELLWTNEWSKCSCYPGHCVDLGTSYDYTNGISRGSEATTHCDDNESCEAGSVRLTKRTCHSKTVLWTNPLTQCRCYKSLYKKVNNTNCWHTCGKKASSCSLCGEAGYCCRKGWNVDGVTRCDADQQAVAGDEDHHVCVENAVKLVAEWRMRPGGQNCWHNCSNQAGPCSSCIPSSKDRQGYCCKRGWTGDRRCDDEQQSVAYNGKNEHVCVYESKYKIVKEGFDCFKACGKSGLCSDCNMKSRKGFCCRKGADNCSAEHQLAAGDETEHVCVARRQRSDAKYVQLDRSCAKATRWYDDVCDVEDYRGICMNGSKDGGIYPMCFVFR